MIVLSRAISFAFRATFMVALSACANKNSIPPRFEYEIYMSCADISKVLEEDYIGLAKRRYTESKNVFLYKSSSLGESDPVILGIQPLNGDLPEYLKKVVKKGGVWGVKFPDTGCQDIPFDVQENYVELYNKYAITLYTKL